jgi:hypothetical protein
MLKEIALNPELMADIGSVKQLSNELVYEAGRLVSLSPSSWIRIALESIQQSDHKPVMKKTLKVKLSNLKKETVKNSNREFVWDLENSTWESNVVDAHQNFPFSLVVVKDGGKNNSPYYSPDEIFMVNPDEWNTVTSTQVERTKVEMVDAMMPLVNLSNRVLIIDPFFNICDANYRATLAELINQVKESTHINKIEIHIASADSEQVIERGLIDYTSPAMLRDVGIEIVVWNIRDFHDRFVLTDVGGFSYGHGFAERAHQGDTHVLVQRVGRVVYEGLWRRFNNLDDVRFRKSI